MERERDVNVEEKTRFLEREKSKKVSEVVNASMHIYVTPFVWNERYKFSF